MTRLESLEAENARLRAALDRIASVNPTHPNCETVVNMARVALYRKPAPVREQSEPEAAPVAPRVWTPPPVAPVQEEIEGLAIV